MSKVEKYCSFKFFYVWKMENIDGEEPLLFKKKFMWGQTDLFRAGMKMAAPHLSSNPAILFLLTTDLHKIGLKVLKVCYYTEFSTYDCKEIKMEQKEIGTGNQLFTSQLKLFENDIKYPVLTFFFTVHFTSIVENYCVHQMDFLLREQLLSSMADQTSGTDFNLIAIKDGKSFRVHKWVLAARSPVFAALLSSDDNMESIDYSMDCTLDEMKQFINFLYTGALSKGLSVSREFIPIAEKYQIKTFEDLCRAALEDGYDFSEDKLAVIALDLECGSHAKCNLKNESDVDVSDESTETGFIIPTFFECSCSVLDLWTKEKEDQEAIKMRVPFEHGGKKMFLAELDIRRSSNQANKSTLAVKFICYAHADIIVSVDYSINPDQKTFTEKSMFIKMCHEETIDEKLLKVFTSPETELTTQLSCPFLITFLVEVESTLNNFMNTYVDSTWSEQMWAASVNKTMTDVEFLVGEMSFGAHRSLLSARSPVFAAMFASGMEEDATGQVIIKDVDPTTFQHFLKFLYTGMFEPSPLDRELFTVADKYGVETLMDLCRPSTKIVDLEHLFDTFLSR